VAALIWHALFIWARKKYSENRKKGSAITNPKMGSTVTPLSIKPIDISKNKMPNPIFENLSNKHDFSIIQPPFKLLIIEKYIPQSDICQGAYRPHLSLKNRLDRFSNNTIYF
jgi:hypothetical protein